MRIGTDIIEIDRIQEAVARSPRFASKVLTAEELARYETMKEHRALEFLAGRFAAKEAYVKALGTGIGRIRFTDMSIANTPSGAPYFGPPDGRRPAQHQPFGPLCHGHRPD